MRERKTHQKDIKNEAKIRSEINEKSMRNLCSKNDAKMVDNGGQNGAEKGDEIEQSSEKWMPKMMPKFDAVRGGPRRRARQLKTGRTHRAGGPGRGVRV